MHGPSKSRRTGKRKNWPLHYTMDFKNPVLEQQHKHYTAHANVRVTPLDVTNLKNWFDTVPSPMLEEDNKTLLTLPDEFYSEDIKAIINRWNPQDQAPLKEFRPEDIAGSAIGPDFLTYDLRILDDLDHKRRNLIQEELELYLKEEAARVEKEAKT